VSDTSTVTPSKLSRQRRPTTEPAEREGEALAVDQALATSPRWRINSKSYGEVIDAILKTLLVITVFLGGFEYFSRQQTARVEKSLALVDEWQGRASGAMQRINDVIWPLYAAVATDIEAASTDPALRARLLGNLGDAVTGRDEDFSSPADRDVDTVFDFFDRAGLCANERICDYDVLATFLGDAAEPFWLYFAEYAARRRAAGYVGYGAWTERFAEGQISRSWFGVV
jgi:hypothetical protein